MSQDLGLPFKLPKHGNLNIYSIPEEKFFETRSQLKAGIGTGYVQLEDDSFMKLTMVGDHIIGDAGKETQVVVLPTAAAEMFAGQKVEWSSRAHQKIERKLGGKVDKDWKYIREVYNHDGSVLAMLYKSLHTGEMKSVRVTPDKMRPPTGLLCHGSNCDSKGTKKCSGCCSVRYCSRTCQRKHWSKHKKQCKRMRVMRERFC